MATPHKHAAAIHAFAEGATILWRKMGGVEWRGLSDGVAPSWLDDHEYCVAPATPEYPASTISDPALWDAWHSANGNSIASMRAIADASTRHEYETGAAVPKAEHEAALVRLGEQLRQIAVASSASSAMRTLEKLGYTDCGGELWKPPLGKVSGSAAIKTETPVDIGLPDGDRRTVKIMWQSVENGRMQLSIKVSQDDARELAIAEDASVATYNRLYTTHRIPYGELNLDLAAVIASVK